MVTNAAKMMSRFLPYVAAFGTVLCVGSAIQETAQQPLEPIATSNGDIPPLGLGTWLSDRDKVVYADDDYFAWWSEALADNVPCSC